MMQVLNHHIYEFKKGVREMVLCTFSGSLEGRVKARLEKDGIPYMIQRQINGNINVFFGKKDCLFVASSLCRNKPLNKLTPEEDFILGTLLGYSLAEQCRRYSSKKDVVKAIFINS